MAWPSTRNSRLRDRPEGSQNRRDLLCQWSDDRHVEHHSMVQFVVDSTRIRKGHRNGFNSNCSQHGDSANKALS